VTAVYSQAAPAVDVFSPAREMLEGAIHQLSSSEALAMDHAAVEAYVDREGREVQRRLLQAHLDLRAKAERPVRVVGADGVERPERRRRTIGLTSLFGDVRVEGFLYQATGVPGLAPANASLNLPDDRYSLGLRRRIAEEVSSGSYEDAVERVTTTTGAEIAKRQAEQLAGRAANDFESFYAERRMDVADEKDKLLVLTFDAAGIVVRAEDLRPATKKALEKSLERASPERWPAETSKKSRKLNRKRMAQVAAIYGVDPFPRIPEDILRDLRPVRDATPKTRRPKPVNKCVRASVACEPFEVIEAVFAEGLKRDPNRSRTWVVVLDGNETQLECVYRAALSVKVEIVVLLDVIHVLGYLWKAANCFHPKGSAEAQDWVNRRLLMLLQGVSASNVAAGMTRSATLQELEARDGVDTCAAYLCKYRNIIQYKNALAKGFPIASGVIEGACRYLIRDRMDKTGAHWSVAGAEAVLKLRALRTNDDWDEYWTFHTRSELTRNHTSRYAGGAAPSVLPSTPHIRRVK
jgi:hypothetical protein